MSPEAQRIAIAEACGWRRIKEQHRNWDGPPELELWGARLLPDGENDDLRIREEVPDYLNSLDAIFGAIKMMTNDQKDEVVRRIGWSAVRGCWDNSFIANATPAQWSRAFLQTLNLWTE